MLNIPTFSLKDVKNLPYQVIIVCLIASNFYFINRGDGNAAINQERVDRVNHQKDSIAGKYFDALYELSKTREMVKIQDSALNTRDSLLRSKTERPAKEIINKR